MESQSFKSLSIDEFNELAIRPDFAERIKKEHEQLVAIKLPGTIDNFLRPENSSKNRSESTPCWDQSRVILKPLKKGIPYDSDTASTYIHANFVDGFEDPMKFIYSQSPIGNTCEGFWRMVAQENSLIIVSLTKVDNADEYCYEYWANEKGRDKVFGSYVIKTLEIIKEETFTRTRLLLEDADNDISREIHHFWYTNWPRHHGWPIKSLELFNLIFQVNQKREELIQTSDFRPGPIVVHCSGGMNWAGIFCAIDIELYRVQKKQTVWLSQTVLNIRKQRHSSFFCSVDYEICYRVLYELI
uniref:Putative tyrosine phosphatase 1 n=1 Tax=Microplitis mediator bracovirus TaxID=1836595 RepID=A0A2I6SGT5_9VIRU|nr:putative tyrosine phosphatase 1 [Microplitis mediator bracovirus]